jgi:hypothetical protein
MKMMDDRQPSAKGSTGKNFLMRYWNKLFVGATGGGVVRECLWFVQSKLVT